MDLLALSIPSHLHRRSRAAIVHIPISLAIFVLSCELFLSSHSVILSTENVLHSAAHVYQSENVLDVGVCFFGGLFWSSMDGTVLCGDSSCECARVFPPRFSSCSSFIRMSLRRWFFITAPNLYLWMVWVRELGRFVGVAWYDWIWSLNWFVLSASQALQEKVCEFQARLRSEDDSDRRLRQRLHTPQTDQDRQSKEDTSQEHPVTNQEILELDSQLSHAGYTTSKWTSAGFSV